MTTLAITPLDVLILRGNRLFGGGVHGTAQMPPWPSVIAGAVASRGLADNGRVAEVTRFPERADEILAETFGADFGLTRLALEQHGKVLLPAPADLLLIDSAPEGLDPVRLRPVEPPPGAALSSQLPLCPVAESAQRKKPVAQAWIQMEGYARHLAGEPPDPTQLARRDQLWAIEPRLGIALNPQTRTAASGALYTTDAVALKPGVRLLARFHGANLPQSGLIRLGGDGRAARIDEAGAKMERQMDALGKPQSGWPGFRMVLATPGLFPSGWLPPRLNEARHFSIAGLQAELVAAAVPRHEVISGWDLAMHAPKAARKVVPAGSCYWFRVTDGDTSALNALHSAGLWGLIEDTELSSRRREGWNHVWFGIWEA